MVGSLLESRSACCQRVRFQATTTTGCLYREVFNKPTIPRVFSQLGDEVNLAGDLAKAERCVQVLTDFVRF